MKFARMFIWFVSTIVVVFLAFAAYLYFTQSKMIFYPTAEFVVTPEEIGVEAEDVYIPVAINEKIHGWYFLSPDSAGPRSDLVFLFFHGNGGNISHRFATVSALTEMGLNLFMIDYRGYGKSDGDASEENMYDDATAAYHWLINEKHYRPDQIIIFGRSLGGAVAIELATREKCRSLLVESSFTSIYDMARKLFPYFPVKFLLRFDFDSLDRIGRTACPVGIVHSPEDDVIPYEMGQKLFAAANEPKRFLRVSGLHNDHEYMHRDDYRELIDFLCR